jgi:hypothetical protein
MKKRWFTLNRVQKLVNMAGVRLVKFAPARGDLTMDYRSNKRIRGVHLGFPNGVTLSVQWGVANYCDQGLTTCEIMAMDEDDHPICIPYQLLPEHCDQVIAHVDQEDLLIIIKECAGITEKIRKEFAPVL